MDRGSDKHSARMDDRLKHEVDALTHGGTPLETRAQEWRLHEPSGEDEPEVNSFAGVHESTNGDGVGSELRTLLARHIRRSTFPARRDTLIRDAKSMNAPDALIALIGTLPELDMYDRVEAVFEALGGTSQHRF